MTRSLLLLYLGLVLTTPYTTATINCYTCVSVSNDLTCVNDPTGVSVGSPITNCMMAECCTIIRQEYSDQPGKIVSFSRGCQRSCMKNGFYPTSDAHFKTYLTYCSEPLCNVGKGDKDIIGGGGGSGGGGDNSIDGIIGDGGAVKNLVSLVTLFLGIVVAFLGR